MKQEMKITFVSNYINHHQIPLSNVLYEHLGEKYTFIQTEPMEEERVSLGWSLQKLPPYVRCAYEEREMCQQLVMDSDVVIWGGLEDESMLQPRLQAGLPVFRYSERLYRTGQWKAISPRGLRKKYFDHTRYRKDEVYLLCSGAYVASDFSIIHAYPNKMLRWGYFPACQEYDIEKLWTEKNHTPECKEILWAARFISLKHPELMVELAEELVKSRTDFHITMLGDGELRPVIEQMIHAKGLEKFITLAGTKKPEEVRQYMEKAPIFLFTSDKQEGWGAVMNESMNSGCAVIANRMIGAVPFLINNGKNGYWYRKGNVKVLKEILTPLLDDRELCETIGKRAYKTIVEEWNPCMAAERLLQLCEDVVAGQMPQIRWESGPCSKAEIIKERS